MVGSLVRSSHLRALLVGFTKAEAVFCHGYRVLGRIRMPVENEERGRPIEACRLNGSLSRVWPEVLALYDD